MTIDPTKIRVGDEVTVRAIVACEDGGLIKLTEDWFNASEILSHTPAPRPFVVGGKVRNTHDGRVATVICIHEDMLWLKIETIGHFSASAKDYESCE